MKKTNLFVNMAWKFQVTVPTKAKVSVDPFIPTYVFGNHNHMVFLSVSITVTC